MYSPDRLHVADEYADSVDPDRVYLGAAGGRDKGISGF
jgi:hypothetical protein